MAQLGPVAYADTALASKWPEAENIKRQNMQITRLQKKKLDAHLCKRAGYTPRETLQVLDRRLRIDREAEEKSVKNLSAAPSMATAQSELQPAEVRACHAKLRREKYARPRQRARVRDVTTKAFSARRVWRAAASSF